MAIIFILYFLILYLNKTFIISSVPMLIIHIVLIATANIMLAYGVCLSSKNKQLENYKKYTKLTAYFDIIGLLVYLFFTKDVKKKSSNKASGILMIAGVILITVNIALFWGISYPAYQDVGEVISNYRFSAMSYQNEKDESILYDKKGNEYTIKKAYNFLYYDRNGNTYTAAQINQLKNTTDNEYVLDKEGYLCTLEHLGIFYRNNNRILYDENGELYYDYDNCYWDKDGKLYFYPEWIEKYTYKKVIETEKKENINFQFCFENDRGIYVFYDKSGKEYPITTYDNFDVYDRNGKVYHPYYDEKSGNILFKTEGSDKDVVGVIDKDGCFIVQTKELVQSNYSVHNGFWDRTDYAIWYDSDGNLYYYYYDCHWDKDGNLLIDDNLAKATYDKVKD